ncbi:DUF6497 family protein [Puniceibacterium antarcticum]|nr:DUF6497 family protein [Puniceibacterium antarcticum]
MLAAGSLGQASSAASDVTEEIITLSSGDTAQLQEVIEDASGMAPVARFRFVAPWVADGAEYDRVTADMEELCQSYALGRLPDLRARPSLIVISLSQAPTDFGVPSPEITQFFESYSLNDGRCVWEPF